jgi:hypothetical protein
LLCVKRLKLLAVFPVKQFWVFRITLLKLQVHEFWRGTGVRNDGKARHPCYRSVLRRSMPWRRSRPERCSGEVRNQLVVIRQVAQCFWMEGLHSFSCVSPSCVRNVLCAPHPSHLNTLLGMVAASLAREEGKSARFISFRQACVNQDLRPTLRALRVVETLADIRGGEERWTSTGKCGPPCGERESRTNTLKYWCGFRPRILWHQ